jgi:hypothetical protein
MWELWRAEIFLRGQGLRSATAAINAEEHAAAAAAAAADSVHLCVFSITSVLGFQQILTRTSYSTYQFTFNNNK